MGINLWSKGVCAGLGVPGCTGVGRGRWRCRLLLRCRVCVAIKNPLSLTWAGHVACVLHGVFCLQLLCASGGQRQIFMVRVGIVVAVRIAWSQRRRLHHGWSPVECPPQSPRSGYRVRLNMAGGFKAVLCYRSTVWQHDLPLDFSFKPVREFPRKPCPHLT